ncbi:sensor histidine kinase [Pseudoalteromonas sp. T1lg65]|uniref:sensor histidine kinase n=1 Tax=Pseudoalteromonas sp. T1lg65 TaxID=2077101 RepID=UPI003F7B1836
MLASLTSIKKPTKAYWLCQLMVVLVSMLIAHSTVIFLTGGIEQIKNVMPRSLVSATGIVIISHFLIRNGSHFVMSRYGWTQSKFWLLAVLSLPAAIANSLWFEYVTLLTPGADSAAFTLPAHKGQADIHYTLDFHNSSGAAFKVAAYYGQYLFWSLCYYVITGRREKKRLQQALKEQQLAGLLNQINPHFLFNSLNTIRGMIYQDQDKAAEVVTQLSELFRYNLSTDLRTHVAFKDEWHICCQYLEIESVRFGKRLNYRLGCPTELEHVTVPSMSVLTLVENAVKHGISHLPSGGEISVVVALGNTPNSVEITVKNPFDAARVNSGTQLGLQNIRSRLAIMFDGQGKLLVEPSDNEYVVRMVIPNGK